MICGNTASYFVKVLSLTKLEAVVVYKVPDERSISDRLSGRIKMLSKNSRNSFRILKRKTKTTEKYNQQDLSS